MVWILTIYSMAAVVLCPWIISLNKVHVDIKKQANQCTLAREYEVAAAVQAQDTQESWAYM
mgnify:CR=1 FL=1